MLSIARRPSQLATRDLRPFTLSPDPRFLYPSRTFEAALQEVTDAVLRGDSLVVVTGLPGAGKTTLCRSILAHLDYRTVVSIVMDPRAGIEEILEDVLRDFGVTLPPGAPKGRHQLVAELQRFVMSLMPVGARALIIVDEAQQLPAAVLEEIRLLLNCETDTTTLLQFLLVGQPPLAMPPLLEQRVTRRCHLGVLAQDEIGPYINHRLHVSAVESETAVNDAHFTSAATRAIARLSGGVPRTVNMICARAHELERPRGTGQIGVVTAYQAARGVTGSLIQLGPVTKRSAAAVGAIVLASAAMGIHPSWWRLPRVGSDADTRNTTVATAVGSPGPAVGTSMEALRTPLPQDADVTSTTLPAISGVAIPLGSFASVTLARTASKQAIEAGLPGFVKRGAGGYQVMAGPYLAAEEARAARRGGETRVGQVSASATSETIFQRAALVQADGRVSVLLELTSEPREITTSNLAATSLEIDLGPLTSPPSALELNAPDGALLVDHVSVRPSLAPDGSARARTRVTLWQPARSSVRVAGRRVYVDFEPDDAAPVGDGEIGSAGPAQSKAHAPQTVKAVPVQPERQPAQSDASHSRDALRVATARLDEILPFVVSAARSPQPEVLGALNSSVSAVQETLRAITPTNTQQRHYELVTSAAALAVRATSANFAGDRASEARQAAAIFAAARAESSDSQPR
jgi:type II secretory pathway predicted ATPase ExeA